MLLEVRLPQRCCQHGDASLSLLNPGSRQILSWSVGVVVSCAKRRVRSHLVVGGYRSPLRSWGIVQFHWQIRCIPIGIMGSAAVAVVLGAADLGWLGQHEEHLRLGFHFRRRAVRSRISWRRYADACFVVAAFLILCVRATQYHSRWYRVQVRQSTRGWMWNFASLGSRLRST